MRPAATLTPPLENTVQAAIADPYVFVSPTIQGEYFWQNVSISDWFSLLPCPFLFRSRFSQDFTYQAAAVFLHPQPFHDTGFPSSLSLTTERHITDMLLSADASTPTSHSPATTTIHTDPPTPHHGYFLPTNPMPYMAPSATHQPELLLLYWLIDTIATLVDNLRHHPIVHDPVPPMSFFTNTPAYRLYRIFQFLPGSPGSPGHYRMDPTVTFAPGRTNYLSDHPPSTFPQPHTTVDNPPLTQPPLIRHLHTRHRSRSRDRLPLTTPTNPNLLTQPRQPLANITPAATGQRGQLHRALWTASTTPAADPSAFGPAAHPP